MGKILTRMGDGSRIEMSEAEIQEDLEAGSQDAAERAEVPPLTDDELKYLLDLYKRKDRVVGVEEGKECCLTYDNMTSKIKRAHIPISKIQQLLMFERGQIKRAHIPISKIQQLLMFERGLGADTLELTHIDYSFKQLSLSWVCTGRSNMTVCVWPGFFHKIR
jgi:dimethylamine--corrinoid protein Co-methyltransferase